MRPFLWDTCTVLAATSLTLGYHQLNLGNKNRKTKNRLIAISAQSNIMASPRFVIPFECVQFGNKIGAGRCGAVYSGTLLDTKQEVAIKELTGAEAMDKCKEECCKHMKLHHRNIVRVCGVSADLERDHAYIITELAPRGSLAEALKLHPQRDDWATLMRWALDIAHGLQYLHSLTPPVLHLDLKPQNVLLFDDDTAKLCDFGISHITKDTVTCRTVQYAAPELFGKIQFPRPLTSMDSAACCSQ